MALNAAAVRAPERDLLGRSARPSALATAGGRGARALLRAVVPVVLVLGLWQVLVWSWGDRLSFSTRGPVDVYRFLTDGANAGVRRTIAAEVRTTLGHAGLGLLLGTSAAIALAFLFSAVRPLEQVLMPVAMVMRSVPLVAMAPLIGLVAGRGLLTVALVGAIVTFFPTLVNVGLGLRMSPQQSIDIVRAYGGRTGWTLLRVRFPFALPSLFAALRATAPLAITGAMLAEFFLVGNGLGHSISVARNEFDYTSMWAQAAIATLASVLVYALAVAAEGAVLARFAPDRLTASARRT